jgi:hypothetical protein
MLRFRCVFVQVSLRRVPVKLRSRYVAFSSCSVPLTLCSLRCVSVALRSAALCYASGNATAIPQNATGNFKFKRKAMAYMNATQRERNECNSSATQRPDKLRGTQRNGNAERKQNLRGMQTQTQRKRNVNTSTRRKRNANVLRRRKRNATATQRINESETQRVPLALRYAALRNTTHNGKTAEHNARGTQRNSKRNATQRNRKP